MHQRANQSMQDAWPLPLLTSAGVPAWTPLHVPSGCLPLGVLNISSHAWCVPRKQQTISNKHPSPCLPAGTYILSRAQAGDFSSSSKGKGGDAHPHRRSTEVGGTSGGSPRWHFCLQRVLRLVLTRQMCKPRGGGHGTMLGSGAGARYAWLPAMHICHDAAQPMRVSPW